MSEGRILGETGALLEPAAAGVISLAYTYLLGRPESAGYFQDPTHLAMRKSTLKGWGIRTSSDPFESKGNFAGNIRNGANSIVKGAVGNPPQNIHAHFSIPFLIC